MIIVKRWSLLKVTIKWSNQLFTIIVHQSISIVNLIQFYLPEVIICHCNQPSILVDIHSRDRSRSWQGEEHRQVRLVGSCGEPDYLVSSCIFEAANNHLLRSSVPLLIFAILDFADGWEVLKGSEYLNDSKTMIIFRGA